MIRAASYNSIHFIGIEKLAKERWYSEGLRFGCRQCGKCCGGEPGYVWVTDADIKAIAQELSIPKPEFERAFVKLVFGRKMTLGEKENGDCVLLDSKTKKCMVYDSRPLQCRTWPFWEDNLQTPRDWKRAAKGCPGCNAPDGKLYTLEEIEAQREQTF